MTSIVRGSFRRHNSDQVNQLFHLVVVKARKEGKQTRRLLSYELFIQVFELLEAIVILQEFFNRALLAVQNLLD